jgi:hypothetical protein
MRPSLAGRAFELHATVKMTVIVESRHGTHQVYGLQQRRQIGRVVGVQDARYKASALKVLIRVDC